MSVHSGGRASRLLTKARGRSNEGIILLVILSLVLVVGVVDSRFWALGSAFNIAHDTLEISWCSRSRFFVVLLVGGIDVSFDAVGIFAGYVVALLAVRGYFDGNIGVAFILAPPAIGLVLGAVNGLAVVGLRLPVLIATLATRSIYVGVLLGIIGTKWYDFLPGDLGTFADVQLVRVPMGRASVGLHPLVIPVALLCVALWFLLSRTMFGRGLYAIGGDPECARRAGFPILRLRSLPWSSPALLRVWVAWSMSRSSPMRTHMSWLALNSNPLRPWCWAVRPSSVAGAACSEQSLARCSSH